VKRVNLPTAIPVRHSGGPLELTLTLTLTPGMAVTGHWSEGALIRRGTGPKPNPNPNPK